MEEWRKGADADCMKSTIIRFRQWSLLSVLVAVSVTVAPNVGADLPATQSPAHGLRMLGFEEMSALTKIAQRIEGMMTLAHDVHTRVWAQGVRDPDGRIGLFIAFSQPFIAPTKSPEMDDRKAWVLLAVFAITKHTEGSPVSPDYIGFTDRTGLNGDRWFYKLEMSTARQVQRQLFARTITMD